jgi:hypothetical protein
MVRLTQNWAALVGLAMIVGLIDEKGQRPAEDTIQSRVAREREFAESLSAAVLVGSYTTDGKADAPLPKERYSIARVTKLSSGLWLFNARIQYGNVDVTVPVPLRVEWAGDTPVITMTDQSIPGLGTFTARVMVYRGQYAGIWQHDTVRGHLFGIIEKPSDKNAK